MYLHICMCKSFWQICHMQCACRWSKIFLQLSSIRLTSKSMISTVEKILLKLIIIRDAFLKKKILHSRVGNAKLVSTYFSMIKMLLQLLGVVRFSHLHHATISLVPEDLYKHDIPINSTHVKNTVHICYLFW